MKIQFPANAALRKRKGLFIALLLLSAGVTNASEPLVVVPPRNTTKAMIQHFSQRKSGLRPAEATSVEFDYDQQHLYIHVLCHDFALEPASNQTHLFKATLYGDHCQVWNDDSVEFRIQVPENSETIFYAGFNANAASRKLLLCQGEQTPWQSNLQVKASIGHGLWWCQVAIPWQELGVDPVPGNQLKLKLTRFRKTTPETSDWPATGYATLRLGKPGLPVIREQQPDDAELKLGILRLEVATANATKIAGYLKPADKTKENIKVVFELHSGTNHITLPGTKNTKGFFQYEIATEDDLLLGRGGWIDYNNQYTELDLKLTSSHSFTLSVNNKIISRDKFHGNFSIPLQQGINLLTLKTASDSQVKPDFQVNGELLSTKWRPDEPKIILNQVSTIFPKRQENIWHFSQDGTLMLHLNASGYSGWNFEEPVHDLKLYFELPEGIDLIGVDNMRRPSNAHPLASSWFHPTSVYQANSTGTLERDNIRWTCYEIRRTIPQTLTKKDDLGFAARRDGCYIALRAYGDVRDGYIRYYTKMNKEQMVEIPRQINFKVHPRLSGQQPKRFHLTLNCSPSYIANQTILQEFLKTVQQSGINRVVWASENTRLPALYGLGVAGQFSMTCYPFLPTHLDMSKLFTKFPMARSTRFNGTKMDTPDFVFLNRHPDLVIPYIKEEFRLLMQRVPSLTEIFWDYEHPAIPNNIDSNLFPFFSPYAMNVFSEQYQIIETLTPKLIAQQYRTKWEEFYCSEVAKAVHLLTGITRDCGLKMILYSGYKGKDTKRLYGIDWDKIANGVDFVYCGYGLSPGVIQMTRQAIAPVPLTGGILSTATADRRHSPAEIIRLAVECQGGILFWYAFWDMKDLQSIAEASQIISQYEDFFTEGLRKDQSVKVLQGQSDAVTVLEWKEKKLLLLLNQTKTDESWELEFPDHTKHLIQVPPGKVKTMQF